jgi:hypothetical protein
MDEMKRKGLYEKSLLIVTADHGMSFLPGASRREPSGPNLSEILSIPLFIKLPGQQTGAVSDANVETIDVMPTVLDVLGIDGNNQIGISGQVDGVSIPADAESPKLRKSILGARGEIVVSAAFPEKKAAVARLCGIFGEGPLNADALTLQTVPELIHRNLHDAAQMFDVELSIGTASDFRNNMNSGGQGLISISRDLIPCYLEGTIVSSADEATSGPVSIAVEINGIIGATVRTGCDPQYPSNWTAMLPEGLFGSEENRIRLYEIKPLPVSDSEKRSYQLHEILPIDQ